MTPAFRRTAVRTLSRRIAIELDGLGNPGQQDGGEPIGDRKVARRPHPSYELEVQRTQLVLDLSLGPAADLPADPLAVAVAELHGTAANGRSSP